MSPDGVHRELPRDDCRIRLLGGRRGRIGLSLRSLPTILPVTYALEADGVVVTTMAVATILDAVYGNVVTFQVDDVDTHRDEQWSVSVTGIARRTGPGGDGPGPIGGPDGRSAVSRLSAFIPTDLMHGVILGRADPA